MAAITTDKWRIQIPEKFIKHGQHPTVDNVGELRKLLEELPDDLPITQGFGRGAMLVVFNIGLTSAFLEFTEVEETEESEDE